MKAFGVPPVLVSPILDFRQKFSEQKSLQDLVIQGERFGREHTKSYVNEESLRLNDESQNNWIGSTRQAISLISWEIGCLKSLRIKFYGEISEEEK